jgi:hypothetical protein
MDRAAEAIPGVMDRLQQAGIRSVSLTLTQPTLDDVFLRVTGQRWEVRDVSSTGKSQPDGKSGAEVDIL